MNNLDFITNENEKNAFIEYCENNGLDCNENTYNDLTIIECDSEQDCLEKALSEAGLEMSSEILSWFSTDEINSLLEYIRQDYDIYTINNFVIY